MSAGIYCIRNTVDNKVYVGSSLVIERRWKFHLWQLRRNSHDNRYLQRAFNKHGRDAFRFIVLEKVEDAGQLIVREGQWIQDLKATAPALGYNLVAYSEGQKIISEETRKRMSASQKLRLPHSEATREKMRNSHLGLKHKPMSEDGKRNITKAMAKRKGVPLSEETKRKMSIARTPAWNKGKSPSLAARQKMREARIRFVLSRKGESVG